MPSAFSSWPDRRRGQLAGAALWLFAGVLAAQPSAPRPAARLIAPLDGGASIGFFIGAPEADSGARPGDAELCEWALGDWIRHSEGRLAAAPAGEDEALIRVYFRVPGRGQYGEMVPFELNGRRGAAVFVRPDTDALDPELARAARVDPLLRETIVYLTCLHELGHALGLEHTANFADIMYYFGFGGDIPAFFGRYRARLGERGDIAQVSGLSAADVARLLELYPAR